MNIAGFNQFLPNNNIAMSAMRSKDENITGFDARVDHVEKEKTQAQTEIADGQAEVADDQAEIEDGRAEIEAAQILIRQYLAQENFIKAEEIYERYKDEYETEFDLNTTLLIMEIYFKRKDVKKLLDFMRGGLLLPNDIYQKCMILFCEEKKLMMARELVDEICNMLMDDTVPPNFLREMITRLHRAGDQEGAKYFIWKANIHDAHKKNDFSKFTKYLKANPEFLNFPSRHPSTHNIYRIPFLGYLLLNYQWDLSQVDAVKKNTILHVRISNADNEEAMYILSNAGPLLTLNIINQFSSYKSTTALHLAVGKGYRNMDCEGNPLIVSNYELTSKLLELGADVHAKTKLGNTALHLACLHRDSVMISLLIKAGAKMITFNENNLTPLDYFHFDLEKGQEILAETVVCFNIQDKEMHQNRYQEAALTLSKAAACEIKNLLLHNQDNAIAKLEKIARCIPIEDYRLLALTNIFVAKQSYKEAIRFAESIIDPEIKGEAFIDLYLKN